MIKCIPSSYITFPPTMQISCMTFFATQGMENRVLVGFFHSKRVESMASSAAGSFTVRPSTKEKRHHSSGPPSCMHIF